MSLISRSGIVESSSWVDGSSWYCFKCLVSAIIASSSSLESEALSSPEYENGKFVKEVSKFRKYSDVLASMRDYVNFIRDNQRYARAVDKSFDPDRYFDEIQRAGYATDPQYAAKLKNISRQIAFMAQN